MKQKITTLMKQKMTSCTTVKLCHFTQKRKKEKKCQPAARDTPDLIQTECVPDRGLARSKNLTKRKKYEKLNIGRLSHCMNTQTQSCTQLDIETIAAADLMWLVNRTLAVWNLHFLPSHKNMNKLVKITNGNGTNRKGLTVIHWNMGSKYWQRKIIEAEAVALQYKPDLLIISEANLMEDLNDQQRNLTGYSLLLPKTTELQMVARIIMYVKDGLNVVKMEEIMDNGVAAIWVKVGGRGKKPLIIAGVYREHKYLFQGPETSTDRAQTLRWFKFVESWKRTAVNRDVVVIGDTNLDYSRLSNPDQAHQIMVDKMKLDVEMNGFHQLVQGITWSWPGQPDSLLDQVWVNNLGKVISVNN